MLRHVVPLLTLAFVAAGCADERGSMKIKAKPTYIIGQFMI